MTIQSDIAFFCPDPERYAKHYRSQQGQMGLFDKPAAAAPATPAPAGGKEWGPEEEKKHPRGEGGKWTANQKSNVAKNATVNAMAHHDGHGGSHPMTKELHSKAAVAHREAAEAHGAIGDHDKEEYHKGHAERHERLARGEPRTHAKANPTPPAAEKPAEDIPADLKALVEKGIADVHHHYGYQPANAEHRGYASAITAALKRHGIWDSDASEAARDILNGDKTLEEAWKSANERESTAPRPTPGEEALHEITKGQGEKKSDATGQQPAKAVSSEAEKPTPERKTEGKMEPLTVTLAQPATEKQRAYMDDLLQKATATLRELSAVAPRSTAHVAAKYRESFAKPKTWFADRIISLLRDKDWLSEIYSAAERELRDKTEKEALKPLRQAAANAFNAIPAKKAQSG